LDSQPYPYGVINKNIDEKLSLSSQLHYLAKLVWFEGSGYLEYKVKNPLPKNSKVRSLNLFLEASPGVQENSFNKKTDITVSINGKKIGTHTISSNHEEEKGKYTPDWWPMNKTQYGKPIFIEVNDNGTFISDNYSLNWVERKASINFQKASDIKIRDLNLNQSVITLKISVDSNAQYKGGMSFFGEKFGNYKKALSMGLEYEGEKEYQPKIIEIINNPEKYENKTVIIKAHPGGWSCPNEKAAQLPEGFSRSATMIYDDTGCLYGKGDILVGKILSQNTHDINAPGNETIIIKGRIKLDKNTIPFITPLNEVNK